MHTKKRRRSSPERSASGPQRSKPGPPAAPSGPPHRSRMPGFSLLSLGLSLAVLWGTLSCERHSLRYIYTALSRPVKNPGIHQFTAMGRLDTHTFDYYDSDLKVKVPKQPWMKESYPEDYWTKGTKSRKSKQDWFKVNLDILKERMNHTDQEVHVLQWMHGCEVDLLPDGRPSFQRGIEQFSYDGNSFLYFDDVHGVWVAAAEEAKPTERKYGEKRSVKDHTKGYLEKKCPEYLRELVENSKKHLLLKDPPKVYLFASPARQKENMVLTCMATGFYPPDIILTLTRNGYLLDERDGVNTTGIRPNEDDTYQRRDNIEILRSDRGLFTCEFSHAETNMRIRVVWDGEDRGVPLWLVLGGLLVLVALVAIIVVGVVLYKKQKKQQPQGPTQELQVEEQRLGFLSGIRVSVDGVAPPRDSGSRRSSDSAIGSSGCSGSRSSSQDQGGSREERGLFLGSAESGGSTESV